ncbi:MAG: ComF family protein [Gammaproteobacteria bacterium]
MKGINKIYKLVSLSSRTIYPWVCCMCGGQKQTHIGVCHACIMHLPWCFNEPLCSICGLPLAGSKSARTICGICQHSPPYYDHIHANFWYQAPIDRLISDYKYQNQWQNAQTLIDLSAVSLANILKAGLVIPMPSHPMRIRQRGFNAVYELIKLLSKKVTFNYELNAVIRSKNTDTQTGKLKPQRRKNVKGAFNIIKPLEYEHVIIFDEVVTTAATVNELSYCLKQAGIKRVTVCAIARTK